MPRRLSNSITRSLRNELVGTATKNSASHISIGTDSYHIIAEISINKQVLLQVLRTVCIRKLTIGVLNHVLIQARKTAKESTVPSLLVKPKISSNVSQQSPELATND